MKERRIGIQQHISRERVDFEYECAEGGARRSHACGVVIYNVG